VIHMRWSPRRNGGNNNSTRQAQSKESRVRDGHGASGYPGHHSWAKHSSGSNKVGAISSPNSEWSPKARKEEDHLTGTARQAEIDSIDEWLDSMDEGDEWYPQRLDRMSDEYLAYADSIPGVTIDGVSFYNNDFDDPDYYEMEED